MLIVSASWFLNFFANVRLSLASLYVSNTVPRTHIDDEYANASEVDPKILITTSRDPSAPLTQFAKVGIPILFSFVTSLVDRFKRIVFGLNQSFIGNLYTGTKNCFSQCTTNESWWSG